MKKNILIIGLAGMIGLSSGLISCSPDYETEFKVSTLVIPDKSQAPIVFSLKGGEQEIAVQTNVPFDNWKAVSNAEWCQLTREKDKVVVSVGGNDIYQQRQAEITISYGHQSYSITVSQFGLEPVILVGEDMVRDGYIINADAESKTVTIPVATNLKLDNIVIPDTCEWVHTPEVPEVSSTQTRAENVNKYDLKFTLDQSTDTVVRYCTVILQSSENYSYVTSFQIKQHERGYIIDIEDAKKTYNVTAMGETITVPFKVNGPSKAYSYVVEESAQSWITPAPATRSMRDAFENFIIQPNIKLESRVGHITFRSTDPKNPNEFTVTVTQEAFNPVPPVCVMNATAIPGAGFIQLKWEIPVDVNYTKIKVSYYDKVAKEDKVIEINDNKTTSLVIDNTYQCAGEYEFTIKTYGPTDMETENPVVVKTTSNEAVNSAVKLTTGMLSANATQTNDGGGLPALVDGDIITYYHSLWGGLSPGSKPHYIQIDLTGFPLKNVRFEYDSRNLPSSAGDVTRAGIWGSNTGTEGSFVLIGKETYTLQNAAGGHTSPNENVIGDKYYKYIRFVPEARRGKDPLNPAVANDAWFNMSNLFLFRVNDHDESWAKKELGI